MSLWADTKEAQEGKQLEVTRELSTTLKCSITTHLIWFYGPTEGSGKALSDSSEF